MTTQRSGTTASVAPFSNDEASAAILLAPAEQDGDEDAGRVMTYEWDSCCGCCRPRRSWRKGLIVVLASLIGAWLLR